MERVCTVRLWTVRFDCIRTIFVGLFVCSEYMMNLESIMDSVYIYTAN